MEFVKEYIVQAISCAANNLRLSSEKIEVVALLRERLNNAQNITDEINLLKKVTEFSKFAIKVGELKSYIENGKVDFSKISEKFKEHSHYIVKDLSYILDIVTPQFARNVFKEIDDRLAQIEVQKQLDLTRQKDSSAIEKAKSLTDQIKEHLILDDIEEDTDFIF